MNRLREIDFLRGIAILFVLLRHIPLCSYTTNMGWIGVDLFFVLSGYLVSGLLFNEFIKFGNIKFSLFLIRRGFKIYPIYFIFYIFYLILKIIDHDFSFIGFIADFTFTQNYIWGVGYAYPATWSLAVEEHFYFLLALFLWLGLKHQKLNLTNGKIGTLKIEFMVLIVLILVFLMRIFSNIMLPLQLDRNFTMTHLRIDSLLFGVLISYLYHFKRNQLKTFYSKWSSFLLIIFLGGMAWTPFITEIFTSFFVKTIGFTLLYISFGSLLIIFLMNEKINEFLNRFFSNLIVNIVSKIGYCSYSIYIIHTLVIKMCINLKLFSNFFIIATLMSVVIGILMTITIEKYFLSVRDKFYPRRNG